MKKRINQLIEERVISNFGAINDPTKFGYVTYALYTRIIPETPLEMLKKPFEKLNNIFFAAKMVGDYDFIFYLYAKTPHELNSTVELIKKEIGKYIIYYESFIQDRVLFWRQFTDGIYNDLSARINKK